jgi:hypothetical protein
VQNSVKTLVQFHEQAEFLRESSGSNIEKTLLKAVKVFALFRIPHFVCGGFAVQEHGYPRFTVDVDIIVPDVEFAHEKLCLNGFKEKPGSSMTVTDRDTRVEIDLHPAAITFAIPTYVSEQPQIITLDGLISSKLSTYIGRGIQRVQDYADVVKLIQANHLAREFDVDPKVRDLYQAIWDGLHPDENTPI